MRSKDRLTITLSADTLQKIDALVDRKEIRNRSHAIEYVLNQTLKPKVDTAVLLAGGNTKEVYGPLAQVDGKTLLVKMLSDLKQAGITNIVMYAGKNEAKIRKEIGDGKEFGVKVTYGKEQRALGGAGAVKAAKKYITSNPFLVLHTDILIGINYKDFIEFHEREKALATVAVKPRIAEESYGKVALQGNKIIDFMTKNDGGISIVNAGAYIFDIEIFSHLPSKHPASFEKDVFPTLAKQNQLTAFLFQGIWFDVSTKKDLTEAQRRWKELQSERG